MSEGKYRLNDRKLAQLIGPYRKCDNVTNVKWIALEYLTLALVLGPTVTFLVKRAEWGIPFAWTLPVVTLAMFLVGGLQHRLSGLGHEASHFCLFRNRRLNELASDLLCMFPIFATTQQYRLVHMAHHQFTNDWDKDPDLANIGDSKLMDRFPMSRGEFLYNFFFRFLYPPALFRYLWDVLYLSVFGQGKSPYQKVKSSSGVRGITLLGIGYFVALIGSLALANKWGASLAQLAVVAGSLYALAVLVWSLWPRDGFFESPLHPVVSSKTTAVLRLSYYTVALVGFAVARQITGINFGIYFLLLWILPLLTTFSYFMLLRDVYQHGNADSGKITNTRVFYTDPFTQWAVFVYGQGLHTPHHLFPAIPHYNLHAVHELLKQQCEEYSAEVVECEGTFTNRTGRPTVLDVMSPPGIESREPIRIGYRGPLVAKSTKVVK